MEVYAQDVFSVGPTLNINLGNKKPKLSWGAEASLWWYEDQFPVSVNLGFDWRRETTVLYSQMQTGLVVAGLSVGPFLELKKDYAPVVGVQTDYWVNFFTGLNYRIRYSGENREKSIGLYARAPLMLGMEEEKGNTWLWNWDFE